MDGQIHHHLSILPTSCARVFPWLRTPNTGFPSVAGSRLRNLTVLTAPNRIALNDSNRPIPARRVSPKLPDVYERFFRVSLLRSGRSRSPAVGHQRSSTNGSLLASRFTANSTAQSNPGCAVWCCSMRPASSRTPKPAVGLNCPASSRTARRWSNGAATSHARRSGNTRL